jgi:hypothetical protein
LLADVAHSNPDGLWGLIRQLEILTTARRDGGASRSGSVPTTGESEQIGTNPALQLAYRSDPAATIALLRAANDALRRAHSHEPSDSSRRVALVIGSNGDRAWGRLATAANDANLLANALTHQGFDLFGGHALINPDRTQLLQAIKDFSRTIGPDTVAFLYYAGHGVQLNGRNYLVPTGAMVPRTEGDFDRNLIAVDDTVLPQMQQGNARLNIVVLDACRDTLSLPANSVRTGAGLAPANSRTRMKDTVIIYSTEPNDVARDSANGSSNSPFAVAFAAAISEPGLELREVFDRVQLTVDQATDHRQQPWISYSTISRFYFGSGLRADTTLSRVVLDDRPFHCPPAGAVATLISKGGMQTITYEPVGQNDPELCRARTSAGEAKTLLYNFFDMALIMDQAQVRSAMRDLFTNHKDSAAFDVSIRAVTSSQGRSAPFTTYHEVWRRIGTESLNVGNQFVTTVKLERRRKDPFSGSPEEAWDVWYSPSAGAFVRGERLSTAGQSVSNTGAPDNLQVVSFGF